MSAANALKAAQAAGISFAIEGDKLVLEAPVPPSPEIFECISQHKAEILNLLRSAAAAWSMADWQAFFDERASILEYGGRLGRLDAEMIAFEDCVDHWLALHPPLAGNHEHCLRCGTHVSPQEQASIVVTCSDGNVGRLHSGCACTWKNSRRWDARSALIWLLPPPRRAAT